MHSSSVSARKPVPPVALRYLKHIQYLECKHSFHNITLKSSGIPFVHLVANQDYFLLWDTYLTVAESATHMSNSSLTGASTSRPTVPALKQTQTSSTHRHNHPASCALLWLMHSSVNMNICTQTSKHSNCAANRYRSSRARNNSKCKEWQQSSSKLHSE